MALLPPVLVPKSVDASALELLDGIVIPARYAIRKTGGERVIAIAVMLLLIAIAAWACVPLPEPGRRTAIPAHDDG
jgi:hypothetical protein